MLDIEGKITTSHKIALVYPDVPLVQPEKRWAEFSAIIHFWKVIPDERNPIVRGWCGIFSLKCPFVGIFNEVGYVNIPDIIVINNPEMFYQAFAYIDQYIKKIKILSEGDARLSGLI